MTQSKRIAQETFDNVVRENVEEFEMDLHEAIEDAVKQFQSQGVDLSNIIKSFKIDSEGNLQHCHPVKDCVLEIKQFLEGDYRREELFQKLECLQQEFEKDEENRKFAITQDGYHIVLTACQHFVKDEEGLGKSLDAFSALINGQGKIVSSGGIKFLCKCLKESNNIEGVTEKVVKAIRHACIKSESNRQTFVKEGVIPILIDTLKTHRHSSTIIKETCFALRVLTFDDDMSVPFGKAHEHAKLIVAENAFSVILDTIKGVREDPVSVAELCSALSRLAVRHEYCKDIVYLGGLKLILELLQENLKDQNIAKQSCTVLKAIAGNDDVKTSIVDAGGLPLIVAAMTTHIKHPTVAEQGCAAIGSIALRSPPNCVAIMAAGGAEIVLKTVQVHCDSAGVQKNACLALRNLVARNPEHCQPILDGGAESVIRRAQERFSACADLAKAALRDLGCQVELRELWTGQSQLAIKNANS